MEIIIVVLFVFLLVLLAIVKVLHDILLDTLAKLRIELDSRLTEEQVKTMINDINVEFTKSWFSVSKRMEQIERKIMFIKTDHEKIEILMGKKTST